MAIEEQIDVDVRSLETCAYSANTFADILSKIQNMVDELSLRQYSNLQQWVTKLDEEVEKRLASRLQAGIQAWTQALEGRKEADVDYTMVYNIKIKTNNILTSSTFIIIIKIITYSLIFINYHYYLLDVIILYKYN